MTKQEQIEEITKLINSKEKYPCEDDVHCENCFCANKDTAEKLYDAGYRKVDEFEKLKQENEKLKAKLEKIPLAIKQKMMEEDDYELTEREQATLFLDRMGSDIEILHDIVENLDELLGKGIDEYIMGIDGVEGLKDMWERAAVMAFAEKVKNEVYPFLQAEMYNKKHFIPGDSENDKLIENQNIGIIKAQDVLSKWFKLKIDELLKEYE